MDHCIEVTIYILNKIRDKKGDKTGELICSMETK